MEKIIIFCLGVCFLLPLFAETIILKSGKTIEAKIIERTEEYIKVDVVGVPIIYYSDEIDDPLRLTPCVSCFIYFKFYLFY